MIISQNYTTRTDGVVLVRTYSDSGMMIERDGVRYSEAIDPEGAGRVYTETDEPIEGCTVEATVGDYQAALARMGVDV